jgi:hypothetical protein
VGSPRPFLDIDYCLPGEPGCPVTQEIPLSAGWNIISSYIAPPDATIETVLEEINNDLVLMKNDEGQIYFPDQNINNILEWKVTEGYQVFMNSLATLAITGTPSDPIQTPIDLDTGWHMIPYLRGTALPIDQALSSIHSRLELVKTSAGDVYWPAYGVNQIGEMRPGVGYELHMTSPGTLIYPGNS